MYGSDRARSARRASRCIGRIVLPDARAPPGPGAHVSATHHSLAHRTDRARLTAETTACIRPADISTIPHFRAGISHDSPGTPLTPFGLPRISHGTWLSRAGGHGRGHSVCHAPALGGPQLPAAPSRWCAILGAAPLARHVVVPHRRQPSALARPLGWNPSPTSRVTGRGVPRQWARPVVGSASVRQAPSTGRPLVAATNPEAIRSRSSPKLNGHGCRPQLADRRRSFACAMQRLVAAFAKVPTGTHYCRQSTKGRHLLRQSDLD